jgi:hypothetical protein
LWSWSYGSWIYNYLCNQCLSPLELWVRIPFMARRTRYNIMWSSLSLTCDRSLVIFSVDSTYKTDSHDITEILLKVVFNTTNHYHTLLAQEHHNVSHWNGMRTTKLVFSELKPGFQMSYIFFMLNDLRREMIVHFVHISWRSLFKLSFHKHHYISPKSIFSFLWEFAFLTLKNNN